ncbi:VirK/YbjX family protein [Duganella sp. sic0402]|uniref:DUF535 family protein n=1 Tax=Duganella sp. sic0402 TaxID=2854786 RepID=UPI001C45EE0A|nr:DUF535 family protein [Duganella sp. sic0402]MBV7535813.1 VirK/YbjX family protein [Duganella sp. sic0402]
MPTKHLPLSLSAGVSNYHGLARLREWLKLHARALLHRQATRDWLRQLETQPLMAALLRSSPQLMKKIYRPYFSASLSPTQRGGLLHMHYQHTARYGLGSLVQRAARGPVQLASVEVRSGQRYALQLSAVSVMEREGELVLQLLDSEGILYSVAFSFIHEDAAVYIGVGGLQGPNHGDRQERVRNATHELHGLRPKNLMIRLAAQWGAEHGCAGMILVGNHNRTVRSAIRQGKVHADYDALWRELDATLRGDGNYTLPCGLPPALTTKARKRHASAEAFCAAMGKALRVWKRSRQAVIAPAVDWSRDVRHAA